MGFKRTARTFEAGKRRNSQTFGSSIVRDRGLLRRVLTGVAGVGLVALLVGVSGPSMLRTVYAEGSDGTSYEVTTDQDIKVTVDAPDGALPQDAKLNATLVDSAEDTQAVADELKNAEVSYDGFLALDVNFTDANGNEVEPSQPVDVRFGLPQGTLPDDAEGLAVHHLAEAADGTVTEVEAVADNADATEGDIAVQDDKAVTADFSVDGFSTFTITWSSQQGQDRQSDPEFTIVDSIATDGRFTAQFVDGQSPSLTDGQYIQYTWTRGLSSDAIDNPITYEKVTGDSYNMAAENGSADATWVNVSLDSEVADASDDDRYWYEVTAQIMNADGTPVAGGSYTATQQVPYYIQLQNGSFENPDITPYLDDRGFNYQFANDESDEMIWRTTGLGATTGKEGKDIEIVRTETDQQQQDANSNHHCREAAAGYQYAELNAEAYGALYQEVMTVPGSTLNWSFSHLPREVEGRYNRQTGDTMALVIMPSPAAGNYIDRLMDAANNPDAIGGILREIERRGEENGYFVREVTSNYQYEQDGSRYGEHSSGNWNTYNSNDEGAYKVGEDQYLTTFFFVAVDTASNNATIGNLLDNVWFSSDPIPPSPDSANLTVTKKVEGIDLTSASDYSVTIDVKDESGVSIGTHTFAAGDFNGSGEATHTFVVSGISTGGSKTVHIEESVTGVPQGYSATSTVQIGNGNPTTGTTTDISVEGRQTYNVTFTNAYTPPTPVDLGHSKYVKYNGNDTYDLSLDVQGAVNEEQGDPKKLDILYVVDRSPSMDYYMDRDSNAWNDEDSRMYAAKSAISTLESALQESDGLDVRHAIVTFHGRAITLQGWTNDELNLDGINTRYTNGTNYQAAIKEAKDQLRDARDDASTVVVFVSDGAPNQSDDWGNALQNACNEIVDLQADYLYAVGVGRSIEFNNLQELVNAATGVDSANRHAYVSSDADELAQYFADMATQLTRTDAKGVSITDTLSEYAELTSDATFALKVTDGQGQPVEVKPTSVSCDQAAGQDGASVSFQSGDQTVQATIRYDNAKSFTVTFPNDYVLDNNWTYTITTQIQPTETAYLAGEDGYTATGESNTGETSDGRNGFPSNTAATLSYESANQQVTKDYPHPVIQVTDRTLGLVITKNAVDADNPDHVIEDGLPGAYFAIYQEANGNDTFDKADEQNPNGDTLVSTLTPDVDGAGASLTDEGFVTDNYGKVSFYGLEPNATYWVVEVKVPDGYSLADPKKLELIRADDGSYTIKLDGDDITQEGFDSENRLIEITVSNKRIRTLPVSGSSGTLLLGSIGVTLIVLAAAYLINRRISFTRH